MKDYRSEKLKPFWLSLHDGEMEWLRWLSDALLSPSPSPAYAAAIQRGLAMPQSRLVPFMCTFLKDLYAIFSEIPSLVVLAKHCDREVLEVCVSSF